VSVQVARLEGANDLVGWQDFGMARLKQIVIDCEHPAGLARFWSDALDLFEIRPYDEAEIARLAGLGFTPETDPVVLVDGPFVELCFQRVAPVECSTKRRLHLDIESGRGTFEAEVQRLVDRGAEVVDRFADHVWMRDPERNDFCVTKPGR
jgi:hypothetical protein